MGQAEVKRSMLSGQTSHVCGQVLKKKKSFVTELINKESKCLSLLLHMNIIIMMVMIKTFFSNHAPLHNL